MVCQLRGCYERVAWGRELNGVILGTADCIEITGYGNQDWFKSVNDGIYDGTHDTLEGVEMVTKLSCFFD